MRGWKSLKRPDTVEISFLVLFSPRPLGLLLNLSGHSVSWSVEQVRCGQKEAR